MIRLIEWEDNVITDESMGRILKRLHKRANYSIMRLAEDCELSYATIVKAERGENVTTHTLITMLDVMGYELIARRKDD